jgi:archaellum component FlaC
MLLKLIQSGLKGQDIIDISELLKTDGNITTVEERKSLGANELGKYDGIKSTIKQLSQEVEKLRNEVASLETQVLVLCNKCDLRLICRSF